MKKLTMKVVAPVTAALLALSSSAGAQVCVGTDVGTNCQLTSTAQTADISPTNLGFVGPVNLQVRYLGGLANAASSLYFFQGAFNKDAPLSNATLIGSKPAGNVLHTSYGANDAWMTLPGTFAGSTPLLFGLFVNFAWSDGWLFSGFNGADSWSRIFLPGSAPTGDPNALSQPVPNLRHASPWSLAYGNGLFVGFEDNPIRLGCDPAVCSDFDFNDAVFQVRAVVPEPSTYALLGAGLIALGAVARRRRR